MTLIACLRIANVPVLFGDLLVSSSKPPPKPVSLPAIGTIDNSKSRERYPAGLRQKICAISDRLIIAYAGPVVAAASVVRGLRERFANSEVDSMRLDRFFQEYGVYDLKESQFIGLFFDGQRLTSFGINTYNFSDPYLGECHFGGSGAGKLLLAAQAGEVARHIVGTMRDVDNATSTALAFATDFLGEEMLGGLQETHFGGAFEIGLLTKDGAEKVDDFLNLFWVYDRDRAAVPLLLPTMIKSDYRGGDLIVQRLEQSKGKNGAYVLSDHVVAVISPPDRAPVDRRPTPPDINCKTLCNFYFAPIDDMTARRTHSIYYAHDKKGPVQFLGDGKTITFKFDLAHFKKEWEIVTAAFNKNT